MCAWVLSCFSSVWLFSALPGCSVLGILQARILEVVAMSFSRGSFWARDWTLVSCISLILGEFFTTEPPGKPRSGPFSRWKIIPQRPDYQLEEITGSHLKGCLAPGVLQLTYWFLCLQWYCCCLCLVTKSCPTLLWPHECSPPGSCVHGISQAGILEWVAISFSIFNGICLHKPLPLWLRTFLSSGKYERFLLISCSCSVVSVVLP